MDQFDRSPEDVSFDLDAEEFSLESILDEYKDFQTDAPAPRPQPAYPRRPVKAEMVEEDAAEDAEAEDILMSAELDSALEDTAPETGTAAPDEPPHEDHDVKRYQPKRQRDHATEEEIEKWNETKANAKRLAQRRKSEIDPEEYQLFLSAYQKLEPEARTVIDAMVDGISVQVLAEQLGKKMSTVYSYRRDIYEKVGIQGENKLQQLRVRVSLMRREQTEYGGSPAPSNGENAGQAVNR